MRPAPKQHRIVAKLDQLIALVVVLERQLTALPRHRANLLSAINPID